MPDSLATALYNGDWQEALGSVLSVDDRMKLDGMPMTSVLSAIVLQTALGTRRCNELLRQVDILPEINTKGMRRCVYIHENGKRCEKYAEIPVCNKHFERACMLSNHFKSASLRKEYEKLMRSPYKMHLDSELSMMRLMLGALTSRIGDGGIPIDHIVAITQMCEKISGVVEKMSKMNTVTPETVDKMMAGVVDILAKYVDANKLPAIAAEIQELNPKVNSCDIPYEPGDTVNLVQGESFEVEAVPTYKRALLEIAASLKDDK